MAAAEGVAYAPNPGPNDPRWIPSRWSVPSRRPHDAREAGDHRLYYARRYYLSRSFRPKLLSCPHCGVATRNASKAARDECEDTVLRVVQRHAVGGLRLFESDW